MKTRPTPEMKRLGRGAGSIALAMLLLAACSSGGGPETSRPRDTTSTTKASEGGGRRGREAPAGEAGAQGRQPGGQAGQDERTAAPGPTETTGGSPRRAADDQTEEPTPISVQLANECVRPGGTQTITITSDPEVAVGYQSEYSDGNKGGSEKGFSGEDEQETTYGGNHGGVTDKSGRWRDTWTVSVQAPAGPVEVSAFALGYTTTVGTDQATFEVADALGSCD